MWRILQHDEAHDFVLATGESHTVREFCEIAFGYVGLDFEDYVVSNDKFVRPSEVDHLLGDSSLARTVLGWEPKVTFKELVAMMVESDLAAM